MTVLPKGNKVSDWLNKFQVPLNDPFSSSRAWLPAGTANLEFPMLQPVAGQEHIHTPAWGGGQAHPPWPGSRFQKGAPICEILKTTFRNASKIPVLTMKFPHICILGYGCTSMHMTQGMDTYYGIALLYREHVFTCGGDLCSHFTTKESVWLFMIRFLWPSSKFPKKYLHSVYLFWLNPSNNISFRLLLINTATHKAIQIFTARVKPSKWKKRSMIFIKQQRWVQHIK